MKSRNILALLIVLVFCISIILFFKQPESTQLTEKELGGPEYALLTNTSSLNAVLSSSEYFASKTLITRYLIEHRPSQKTANIQDTYLNSDGTISFKLAAGGRETSCKIIRNNNELIIDFSNAKLSMTYDEINSTYGDRFTQ